MSETKLPLTESDCADLAIVLRTPDPLDDHPEVQQRWLALMRKYPGKNALDMAADFLEHLTSAKDCCYNTHADDCPNGIGENGIKQSEGFPPPLPETPMPYDRCCFVPSQQDPGTVRWVPEICGVGRNMHDRAAVKGHDFVSWRRTEQADSAKLPSEAVKTWPDRIYLQTTNPDSPACETLYRNGPYDHESITWCIDRIDKGDVEYIRADLVRAEQSEDAAQRFADGKCAAPNQGAQPEQRKRRPHHLCPGPNCDERDVSKWVADGVYTPPPAWLPEVNTIELRNRVMPHLRQLLSKIDENNGVVFDSNVRYFMDWVLTELQTHVEALRPTEQAFREVTDA